MPHNILACVHERINECLECVVFVSLCTVCSRTGLYLAYCISHELPHNGAFAAVVVIFLDQTTNIIFENQQVLTVTLRLNDTYHEDIVVNVAVGELQGRYVQESSESVICRLWWRLKYGKESLTDSRIHPM